MNTDGARAPQSAFMGSGFALRAPRNDGDATYRNGSFLKCFDSASPWF